MRHWIPIVLAVAAGCSRDLDLPGKAVPVAFSPAFLSAAPWEQVDLAVAGGRAPFRYAFAEGGQNSGPTAAVDPATGRYVAGHDGPAIDFVEVTDAAGSSATARISVGAPFTLSPTVAFVAPGGTVALVPMGGKPPYDIALEPGSPGSTAGTSYVAPAQPDCRALSSAPDTAVLRVTDQTDAPPVTVTITLGRGLDLFPATGDAAVAPAERLTLVASGGEPPYEFHTVTNGSSGPGIDAGRGTYQAGLTGNALDTLSVSDANGQVRCLDVAVGPALSASLSTAEIRPTSPLRIVAGGGRAPYAFAFAPKGNRSRARLDPITGDYTPGPNAGTTDLVWVRDATDAPAYGPIRIDVGQQVLATGNAGACLTADLSGDGRADYVALNKFAPVQLATGIAESGGAPRVTSYPLTGTAIGVSAADLNGTGHASVAVLTSAELRFLMADFDGHLSLGPQGLDTPGVLNAARYLAAGAGQVNGAPVHRFFVSGGAGSSPLLWNVAVVDWPDGAQAPNAATFTVPSVSQVGQMEAFDWNGDGVLDLAFTQYATPTTLRVALGNADGTFAAETLVPVPDPNYRITNNGFQRVRLPGATADDLVVLGLHLNGVDRAFFRLAAGSWTIEGPFKATVDGNWGPMNFAAYQPYAGADVRIAAVTRYSDTVGIYAYPFTESPVPIIALPPRSFGARCVAVGDLDGDGIADLVLSGATTQSELLLGDGDGLFGRRRHFFAGSGAVAVADFDGDGLGDVVVVNPDQALEVQFGTEGQLAVSSPTPTGQLERAIRVADLDGDGRSDVLFVGNDGALSLFSGSASRDGTFGAPQTIALTVGTTGVADPGFYVAWRRAHLGGASPGPDWIVESTGAGSTTLAAVVFSDPRTARSWPLPAPLPASLSAEINADTRAALFVSTFDGDALADVLIVGSSGFWWSKGGAGAGGNPWDFGAWTNVGLAVQAGEFVTGAISPVGLVETVSGTPPVPQRALVAYVTNLAGTLTTWLARGDLANGVARSALPGPTFTPWFSEMGDLNGDGRPDIAIQDTTYKVHVYLADDSLWMNAPVEAKTFQGPGKLWALLPAPGRKADFLFKTPDAFVIVPNADVFP
jgi:hypothetical protein